MHKQALISDCGKYRYQLSRIWDSCKPPVLIVMLNPSTADASSDDPTIRRCINFAKSWGFGGIMVGNLFAFRSTNPLKLAEAALEGKDVIGPENNDNLRRMFNQCMDVVYAWGTHGELLNRNIHVRYLFEQQGFIPKCIGLTKDGHPRHPLYLRQDSELKLFREINSNFDDR